MGLLRDLINAGRYKHASGSVPTEVVVRDAKGRFEFEMPWPWFEVVPEPGQPGLASEEITVAAPRTTEPWPHGSIRAETEKFDLDDATLKADSRALARAAGGQAHRPQRLIVAGVQSVDFAVDVGSTVLHRIVIPEGELTVTADFRLPRSTAPGYEVHIESMLASWRWA